MFKNFPIILINDFINPSAQEKKDLIKQITAPKIKSNNNDGGAVNTSVDYESNSLLDRIYDKYVDTCHEVLKPFTLHHDTSNIAWTYCTNDQDTKHVWHNHTKSSTINSVYYLQIPHCEGNQLEIEYKGNRVDFHPRENDFLIFPNYINHAPMKPRSKEFRISINFELLCNEKAEDIFAF